MVNEKLKKFLHGTDALNSLMSEMEIVKIFQDSQWAVTHGFYYNDPKENKVREIDIKAVQWWNRKVKGNSQNLKLNIIAECKSLKGTNIIIAPYHPQGFEKEPRISHWIGWDSEEEHGLLQAEMVRLGVPIKFIRDYNKEFSKKAFQDGEAKVAGLLVDPPAAVFQTTAFREISSKREKDLDSSVLWRAVQGVSSAVESCYLGAKTGAGELVELAVRFGDKANQPRYREGIISAFDTSSNYVEIWHPVVVLDADLWVLNKKELVKVEWFRFGPFKSIDSNFLWSDVVSQKCLSKYVNYVSNYYKDECLKSGSSLQWRDEGRA